MSEQIIRITQFSTFPDWFLQLRTAAGDPVDLTAATAVKISTVPVGGGARKIDDAAAIVANGTYTMIDGTSLVVTPANGWVIYQPVAGDVDLAGHFEGHVFVTFPGPRQLVAPGYERFGVVISPSV